MPRPATKHPTELELEILKILWRDGARSGRQIREILSSVRDLSYQSVMTTLGIMEEKGYVKRKKVDGSYSYSARVSEKVTSRRMMRDLIDRLFDGSVSTAMVNLLEASDTSDDELKQLKAMVDQHVKGDGK